MSNKPMCHSCKNSEAKWKVSNPGGYPTELNNWLCDACKALHLFLFGGYYKLIKENQ